MFPLRVGKAAQLVCERIYSPLKRNAARPLPQRATPTSDARNIQQEHSYSEDSCFD